MNYRFYRNALIKVVILSVCVCGIFYDALTGHKVGDPAALCLMGALVIGGNTWLTYMMLNAKKRERAQASISQTPFIQTPMPQPEQPPPVLPVEKRYFPSDAVKARRRQRKAMSIYTLVAGFALIGFGMAGWAIDLIPAQYIGFALLVLAGLGVSNVNIWKGSPLDPDKDPQE